MRKQHVYYAWLQGLWNAGMWLTYLQYQFTVMPNKSDSDVILCLQLLSKTLTCILNLSLRESIDHV